MDRKKAVELLKKYNKEEFHIRHAYTVENVMRYFAKENGYDSFSTTLLVSPYQNHEALKQVGKEIAEKYGCRYLDCNEALVDEHGEQKSEYAIDGVHMYANGYLNVFKSLKPYL